MAEKHNPKMVLQRESFPYLESHFPLSKEFIIYFCSHSQSKPVLWSIQTLQVSAGGVGGAVRGVEGEEEML